MVRVNGVDCSSLSPDGDSVGAVYRAVQTGGIWANITIRRSLGAGQLTLWVGGINRVVTQHDYSLKCAGKLLARDPNMFILNLSIL